MIVYHVLRGVEIFVTISIGFWLITQTYELRWDNLGIKIGLGTIIFLLEMVVFLNSFWFQFSGIEYIYIFGVFLALSIIFFRISLLKASVHCMLYWEGLLFTHLMIIFACSYLTKKTIDEYNKDMSSIDLVYILNVFVVVFLMLFLCKKRKGKEFLKLYRKNDYIYLCILLIAEWFIMLRFFSNNVSVTDNGNKILLGMFWLIGLITLAIIYITYNSYLAERHHAHLLKLKYAAVEEQYEYILENYQTKRRQIHDSNQRINLLKMYIQSGQIEEACNYIDEIQDKINTEGIKIGIGMEEIDFILDSKITKAEKFDISIRTDMDVCFCPLGRDDLCVLLGNLLDNAIEAVKEISEKGRRKIFLKLKTVNNMFLLEIKNTYIGERKIINNKYTTTKKNKELHGLGLDSCRSIVECYDGIMEILDENDQFIVVVTIFQDKKKVQ